MGKVFVQVSEFDLDTVLASVRKGNAVVLKDGDDDVASVTGPDPVTADITDMMEGALSGEPFLLAIGRHPR